MSCLARRKSKTLFTLVPSCQRGIRHNSKTFQSTKTDKSWSNSTVSLLLVLQPLRWCCVDCVIHHEGDVREEQKYMYVARTSNNRVISSGDLYCCLLPRYEALRTCRSGFPIATAEKDNTFQIYFCNSINVSLKSVNFKILFRDCFLVLVPNRAAATLEAAVQQHVLPGTELWTDM